MSTDRSISRDIRDMLYNSCEDDCITAYVGVGID